MKRFFLVPMNICDQAVEENPRSLRLTFHRHPSVTTESKLCDECLDYFNGPPKVLEPNIFDSRRAFFFDPNGSDANDRPAQRKKWLQDHYHLKELSTICRNTRNQQCHFCVLIHSRLLDRFQTSLSRRMRKVQSGMKMELSNYLVWICLVWYRQSYQLAIFVTDDNWRTLIQGKMYVITNTERKMKRAGKLPPVMNLYASTGTSLTLAQSWLKSCLTSHDKCKQSITLLSQLPTRLLDVGDCQETGMAVLRHTSTLAQASEYITLSHKWGTSERLCLTQENIEEFTHGIPTTRLALTFRDAITITQRLGFRYLWIDCLCIIQNSSNGQDWACEAGKMAEIYSGAALNIAAASSSDSDGGCFRMRNLYKTLPLRFERSPSFHRHLEHYSGPVLFAKDNIERAWNWCEGPLNERGWILQEQVLAPRTLHFGQNALSWECRQFCASEIWPDGIPKVTRDPISRGKSKGVFDFSRLISGEEWYVDLQYDSSLKHQRWLSIVELYTARSLTFARDKLPALSGIADMMAIVLQDEYVAGLWKKTLPLDLAWRISPDSQASTRSNQYVAPSWSWASMIGKVEYVPMLRQTLQYECAVHSSSVDLASPFPTGAIRNATIQISGLLRRCENINNRSTLSATQVIWRTRFIEGVDLFYDMLEVNFPAVFYLLQLYRAEKPDLGEDEPQYRGKYLTGLVLKLVNSATKIYARIGLFEAEPFERMETYTNGEAESFRSGWEDALITIV